MANAVEQPGRGGQRHGAEVDAEQLAIEKGQCLVGLFESGDRVLLGPGDVFEKPADIAGPEFVRMPFAMKPDVARGPASIALPRFRPAEVVERPQPKLIEQSGRCRGGKG